MVERWDPRTLGETKKRGLGERAHSDCRGWLLGGMRGRILGIRSRWTEGTVVNRSKRVLISNSKRRGQMRGE